MFFFCLAAMDQDRQKRKEEIEKAMGFIQYVISLTLCMHSWMEQF